MKNSYLKMLSALMALLGFPSCEMTELYASPTIDYSIKGKVTEGTEAGKPIPGIRVIWQGDGSEEYVDTVYTNKQGEFNFRHIDTYHSRLIAEDIDGDANGGTFLRDTVELDSRSASPVDKKSKWYEVNFHLKKGEVNPDNKGE
ncbi:MAG: radical SAM-associated putative lipoprotein [Tannerellaceae bacterium]|nr:radical SAM-associated putative lipoprotein [Tannerellaceae bacterium]